MSLFTGILIGLGFYIAIVPIAEQLAGYICGLIECQRMKLSVKAAKLQKEIDDLTGECGITSYPIGFSIPTEVEEEEYADE